jgi:hypothetical protein
MALVAAVGTKELRFVELLVSKGAILNIGTGENYNLDTTNDRGERLDVVVTYSAVPPLARAVWAPEIFQYLLDKGADPRYLGDVAVKAAMNAGCISCVEALLARKIEIERFSPNNPTAEKIDFLQFLQDRGLLVGTVEIHKAKIALDKLKELIRSQKGSADEVRELLKAISVPGFNGDLGSVFVNFILAKDNQSRSSGKPNPYLDVFLDEGFTITSLGIDLDYHDGYLFVVNPLSVEYLIEKGFLTSEHQEKLFKNAKSGRNFPNWSADRRANATASYHLLGRSLGIPTTLLGRICALVKRK